MLIPADEAQQHYIKYLRSFGPERVLRTKTGADRVLRPTRMRPIINGTTGLRVRNSNEQKQYSLDVAMWWGALDQGHWTKRGLIGRIFSLLFYGGLLYKKKSSIWYQWADGNIPIAAALSHGDRIMIQIPKSGNEDFWDWLWGGHPKEARWAATHGVLFRARREPLRTDPAPNLLPFAKLLNEVKGNHNVHHFGVNIGLGGTGNFNPWSGNKIQEDGNHGHLYIGYRPPTIDLVGAVLIGCEGSAPWDRSGGINFAKDQSGKRHTFGSSGKFSPTGGYKWKKSSWHPDNGPASGRGESEHYDSMFVDLTAQGWEFLQNRVFHKEYLGQAGPQPTPHPNPNQPDDTIPSSVVWRLYSELRRDRRSSELKAIDEEVETYNNLLELERTEGKSYQLSKYVCLRVISALCLDYNPSKRRRKDAKDELRRRALAIRQTLNWDNWFPLYEDWMRSSRVSGPRGRRPEALRNIDAKVRAYEALWAVGSTATDAEKRQCLANIAGLCRIYHPQNNRRRVAVEKLKELADACVNPG